MFERIRFNTTVDQVESRKSGGWKLSVTGQNGQGTIETQGLILAAGLTSTPNIPQYHNAKAFDAPLFHAKGFCKEAPRLKGVRNAVVVGGAKSAFDVAYAMVESGATVDIVIRSNGHGPVWIAPMLVTPLKKRLDKLLHVRWMTWFSPCPWGKEDGFSTVRWFLHGSPAGQAIMDMFWRVLTNNVITLNGYDNHPEVQKLKPWNSAFWIGSGLCILNYDSSLLTR